MPLLDSTKRGRVLAVPEQLWCPSFPEKTRIHEFKALVSQKYGMPLVSYDDLWRWSVSAPTKFWEETWHFVGIRAHKTYDHVRVGLRDKGIAETLTPEKDASVFFFLCPWVTM